MKKTKIIGTIIGIILFVCLLGGLTYAWLTWRSNNTIVEGNSACFEIDYLTVEEIGTSDEAVQILLVNDYYESNYAEVSLALNSDCADIRGLATLYLNTNTEETDNDIFNGAFNYTVYSVDENGDDLEFISEGIIDTSERIVLADNIIVNSTTPNVYRIYIWLDGEEADNTYANLSYSGSISVEAIQYEGYSAAQYITNLYNDNKDGTVTNNNIEYSIAPSASLMNDRLGGTTEDLDGGNIRYYGANPNNYVWLGDYYTEDMTIEGNITLDGYESKEACVEDGYNTAYCTDDIEVHAGDKKLWRIIGVFNNKLKLVTDNIISTQGLSWDTSEYSVNYGYGINEWSQSDLMKLLNPGYEEESINNSLYWNKGTGTVYTTWRNGTTSNISFANTGLSESEKNMIEEATWYTGAYNTTSYADAHYKAERENMGKICSPGTYCNDAVTRTNEWPGKVGLISVSDYGYSVDLNSCSYTLDEYYYDDCANNNWLVNGTWYWTMSPRSYSHSASNVFYVGNSGILSNNDANYGASVRPAVYLKSGVSISGGNGSQSDPYELSY